MADQYFNYENEVAGNRFDRLRFARAWRHVYRDDRYWTPPYLPTLRAALAGTDAHSARLAPLLLHSAAMRRPRTNTVRRGAPLAAAPTSALPSPVAAGVLLRDPRRRDEALYLAHLHCINNRGVLARFMEHVAETGEAWSVIGPVGLSPYLHCGVQVDHWDAPPPLYTAYAPPYLDDLVGKVMRPLIRARVWRLPVPADKEAVSAETGLTVIPFDPSRLADDMLPLLQQACSPWQRTFPLPDAVEAAFLLDWMRVWPLHARAVLVDGAPVGFVLLQPDMAPLLRKGGGGAHWWGRATIHALARRPQTAGRIVFGAVSSAQRGRGFGRMLLAAARAVAREHGWSTLTVGPVPEDAPATRWLEHAGATGAHTFQLYQWSL